MTITVTLTDSETRADFRGIHCEHDLAWRTHDESVQHVKGVCLHVIADFTNVPDNIEFRLVDQRTTRHG